MNIRRKVSAERNPLDCGEQGILKFAIHPVDSTFYILFSNFSSL